MDLIQFDFSGSPFQLNKEEKDAYFSHHILELTRYHADHCNDYRSILESLNFDPESATHYSQIPFLPVGLFKNFSLSSINAGETDYKTVTSSGTSGQKPSAIILDGETRLLQQQALASIVCDFIGTKRLPLLIIDAPSTAKYDGRFSARTAGVTGFSIFGKDRTFALTEDMEPDVNTITAFIEKYGKQPFLIFGFTFLVFQEFCQKLNAMNLHPDLSNGILIHGGGWKKLQAQSMDKDAFYRYLFHSCSIQNIHDYYGMAEQTGSIFMECEHGHLHCSDFSEIIFRDPADFSICPPGVPGIIQVLSLLPRSYPGHSLLTEDMGMLLGTDNCPCGRKGNYFKIIGRIPNAEIRGCSDTYERI